MPERASRKAGKLKDSTVALALSKYDEQNGVPRVMPHPRSWDAEKALSRDAWFESIWVEEAKGWRHAYGEHWKPESAPGMATLVLFDYYDTRDPLLRARLRERIDTAMEEALRRMENGEDPEQIEADMGDLLEEEEPFNLKEKPSKTPKRPPPKVDDTLYYL